MRPPKARRIVIAAYEGVSLLDLNVPGSTPVSATRLRPDRFTQLVAVWAGARAFQADSTCLTSKGRPGPLQEARISPASAFRRPACAADRID